MHFDITVVKLITFIDILCWIDQPLGYMYATTILDRSVSIDFQQIIDSWLGASVNRNLKLAV